MIWIVAIPVALFVLAIWACMKNSGRIAREEEARAEKEASV